MIAYGIVGTVNNIDPDKVYDYHTAFDIYPGYMIFNVAPIINSKKLGHISLGQISDDNFATIKSVKELIPLIEKRKKNCMKNILMSSMTLLMRIVME